MSETRVAVLVGSLRADSMNRKLAELLRDQAPEGVTLDLVDGLDQLPFYNEDIDGTDVSAPAAAVRERVGRADRVLAVTPEYNGTMPAVLNNAIDWLSRPYGQSALDGQAVRRGRHHPDAVRRQVVARRRPAARPPSPERSSSRT